MSHVELVLLYEMLKAVGCDDGDPVFAALVAHMTRRERAAARLRTSRRRRARGVDPE